MQMKHSRNHYFLNIMKNTQLIDDVNVIFSNELIAYEILSELLFDDEEFFEKNIIQLLETHWKNESLIDYTEYMIELSAITEKKQMLLIKYAKNHLSIWYNK